MRVVLRPLPVLYACQGCAEFGQAARDIAAFFDHAGAVEAVWLGKAANLRPTSRFPVYALDGCGRGCARRWLEQHGVAPQRSFVLTQA
jgi:uncharacterized metal-binding protein